MNKDAADRVGVPVRKSQFCMCGKMTETTLITGNHERTTKITMPVVMLTH